MCYTGLDAESFDDKDFEFAQAHLRILSGLYGVLKPLRFDSSLSIRNGD